MTPVIEECHVKRAKLFKVYTAAPIMVSLAPEIQNTISRQLFPLVEPQQDVEQSFELLRVDEPTLVDVVFVKGALIALNVYQFQAQLPRQDASPLCLLAQSHLLREAESSVPGEKLPNVDVSTLVYIRTDEGSIDKLLWQILDMRYIAKFAEDVGKLSQV